MLRRVLLLSVVLAVLAPATAQALDAPQLFWRPYVPGTQGQWQPLQGAVVDSFMPEIGILIGADPAGKDPGYSMTVTKVPDTSTASDALRYPGLCFVEPGFAGKINPLYQLDYRGLGTYAIHAVSLTNAEAMKSTICNLASGFASDTTFTVGRVFPKLQLELDDAALDNDSNLNLVVPVKSSWNGFRQDYVCARNAHAGADGLPAGADRYTLSNAGGVLIPNLRRTGRWSCAARYETMSQGSQQTFKSPYGPIFNFDVTDGFRLDYARFLALGGTRYTFKGVAQNAGAPGGKVRVTFTPGRRCPAKRKVSKTMTINAARKFTTTVNLPEGGNSSYLIYQWHMRIEFLGSRFLRKFRLDSGLALDVRDGGGQPRRHKPQTNIFDNSPQLQCMRSGTLVHR